MKKRIMLRRCLSLMLLAALLLSLPADALAASSKPKYGYCGKFGDNLTWQLKDGVLTIYGKGKMKDYDEDRAPWDGEYFTKLRVNEGVTTIGKSAFWACRCLKSVELPRGLASIRQSAFAECHNLSSVKLREGLTHIGWAAFFYCNSLESITLPKSLKSIGMDAFCYAGLKSVTLPDGLTELEEDAFSHCGEILVTPGSSAEKCCIKSPPSIAGPVTYTPTGPVSGTCGKDGNNLTWTFRDGVLTVSGTGEMADYSEYDWYHSVRGDNEESVRNDKDESKAGKDEKSEPAPWALYRIRELRIGEGVVSIGNRAFSNCYYTLKSVSVTLPKSLERVGKLAFPSDDDWGDSRFMMNVPKGSFAENYCIENAFRYLPDEPVSGTCGKDGDNLSWTLEDGLLIISGEGDMADYQSPYDYWGDGDEEEEIGTKSAFAPWALYGFTGLRIEEGVTGIGAYAFQNCDKLENAQLPEGLRSIGEEAFGACSRLENAQLPESLVSIGERAFDDCDSLKNLTLPESLVSIGKYAFIDCGGDWRSPFTASVPKGSLAEQYCIETGIPYLAGTVSGTCGKDGDNLSWTLEDGVLTISGTGDMADYNIYDDEDDYFDDEEEDVAASGRSMDKAPWYAYSVTAVRIREGVTGIGTGAFSDCLRTLRSVELPKSLKRIANGAFGFGELSDEYYYYGQLFSISLPKNSYAETYCRENWLIYKTK